MRLLGGLGEIEGLARFGYAARGVVYLIVGWLALVAAYAHGTPADTKGALLEVLDAPFGNLLLAVVGMGLLGYAAWRVVQAVFDVDRHGTGAKGIAIRGGLLVAGIVHAALAVFAFDLLRGQAAANSGEAAARDWTVWLLSKPFGQILVAAVGVIILGAAAAHVFKAYKAGFRRYICCGDAVMRYVDPIGRIGLTAKGLVFAMVGIFFLTAAWQADSSESGGLLKVLQTLQNSPFGPWLLGAAAVGLFAFGLYSLIEAVYRRIDPPDAMKALRAA